MKAGAGQNWGLGALAATMAQSQLPRHASRAASAHQHMPDQVLTGLM